MSRWVVVRTLLTVAVALALAAAAQAATPRTSLPVIERQVMCVTCKIPLNVAESPQADRERVFIQRLIDKGLDEQQVKDALVGQYGPTVLGLPKARGFDLTAYLVPLVVVIALAGLLAVLLPRWRRRERGHDDAMQVQSALSAADAERLESDLARFD